MVFWRKKPPATTPPDATLVSAARAATASISPVVPDAIRQYRITRKLGEGGMGVVYEAEDPRLGRLVAIKQVRPVVSLDPTVRERLLREARLAAGISHPNICHVYELGEEAGQLFIVMELLSGENLADRIARGPLPLAEALQTALGILAALDALHGRGIVHRDLKPSNVFLTPHGVKLLDFGLARPHLPSDSDPGLTTPGALLGTPRYMAPELMSAEPATAAADIFAFGAILFEMLTGKHAFGGNTVLEVAQAVMRDQPPALIGGADVIAADRVIQKALAKRAADRYPNAAAMAAEVREALTLLETGPTPHVRTMTRLAVLPFRVLRADPEIEFLAYGLPEAITSSLSGLESLTVRSAAAAERFTGDRPDLRQIATELGVDVVLLGTLLRSGDQVRVSTQLVEAPGGTVVHSRTAQVALGDIFQLQDDLTRQIVDALALSLSREEDQQLDRRAPANPEAYELYLRATHLADSSATPNRLSAACDLYCRCLDLDPAFAPAWARLGRVHRVRAKYAMGNVAEDRKRAEEAFQKAFELDPELPLAHYLYTHFEIEEFNRPREAMQRLLELAGRHGGDADLFSGLVVACRFAGLLEASRAADQRARRIDPGVRTSVAYTHWALGDYERTILTDLEEVQTLRHAAMWMQGRHDEALRSIREVEIRSLGGAEIEYVRAFRATLERDKDATVRGARSIIGSGFRDPEGLLFIARALAFVGAPDLALDLISRIIGPGFHVPHILKRDPWLDPIRAEPEFVRSLRRAEDEHGLSLEAFRKAGGERLLGVAG